MDDKDFGVPAGWYPDPLGLPQLRWWDAQAWTEHTSEARAPIVIQPSVRTTAADEHFPSRREQRERERRESGILEAERQVGLVEVDEGIDQDLVRGDEELSAQPLLAMTLRELEPPVGDTVEESTPGPRRASSHANAAPAASALSALAEELPPERAIKRAQTFTGAAWLIAGMPLLQLAALVMLVLTGFGYNRAVMVLVVVAPYVAVIGLAFYDRLLLQVWGHARPASPLWALLTAPAYLIARAIRTTVETGKGFASLAVFGSALVAVLAGVLVLPGIAIGLFPADFTAEVEKSVEADAASLGAELTLTCPAPPLLIGDLMTCQAEKPSGETDSIVVSLQRQNGWIAWQVDDWGNWVLLDE